MTLPLTFQLIQCVWLMQFIDALLMFTSCLLLRRLIYQTRNHSPLQNHAAEVLPLWAVSITLAASCPRLMMTDVVLWERLKLDFPLITGPVICIVVLRETYMSDTFPALSALLADFLASSVVTRAAIVSFMNTVSSGKHVIGVLYLFKAQGFWYV